MRIIHLKIYNNITKSSGKTHYAPDLLLYKYSYSSPLRVLSSSPWSRALSRQTPELPGPARPASPEQGYRPDSFSSSSQPPGRGAYCDVHFACEKTEAQRIVTCQGIQLLNLGPSPSIGSPNKWRGAPGTWLTGQRRGGAAQSRDPWFNDRGGASKLGQILFFGTTLY